MIPERRRVNVLNLLHKDLAYRFGIAQSHVSTIVITWVDFLYKRFYGSRKLLFPPRSEIRSFIPKCFKRFKNIRCIIDCTEIFLQQPSDFAKRGNQYSSYKGNCTAKFLVAIMPNGAICFVSDAFEGAISDKEIDRQSGFLDHINEGDLVLADRGFLIHDELMKKGACLNIPPFLAGRDRFTAEEEVKTKAIAKCRIHVERAIERMKKYKVLSGRVPHVLTPMLTQLVFVIGVLVNYQQPLVR